MTNKVLIDINHPAHVHFLRNLYFELKKKESPVLVVASKKPLVYELLESYQIPHLRIGAYGSTIFSKAVNLIWLNLKMIWIFLKHKPDISIGIVTIRGAHISWLFNKKSFVFTDTEHAKDQIALFKNFATKIYTPQCFPYKINKKQIYYNGYHELAYLHPNYFTPDKNILSELGVAENEKYVIIRFVAWNATHDKGMSGLSNENKIKAVRKFSKVAKVFITSEIPLLNELSEFAIKIAPNRIHHAIYFSSLVFGESATMASEAAVLGVPAVYIDNAGRCYTKEQEEKYQIVYNYTDNEKDQLNAINKSLEILQKPMQQFRPIRNKIIDEKINVTEFLIDLTSN